MRKICLLLIILCVVQCTWAQPPVDALHYRYALTLSDNTDTIYGKAVLTFLAKEPVSLLKIDLAGLNEQKKGMLIDRVTGPAVRSTARSNDAVVIHFTSPVKDTISVSIDYHGVPADGLIISTNKYGRRTFFADNWPNRAHQWIPCIDHPSDKATVEFIVTAPLHYQVIANGTQVEETNLPGNVKLTHYREDVALPTKVMVIGAADFAVNGIGNVGCIPVSSWVFPENKEKGFGDYAMAKNILQYYIDMIGPFPYAKLANVQSKTIFGGMENAGAIFYYENSVNGQADNEKLIAHEIVHQWFGDHATEKSFAHLWLSEGFATYLAHRYIESKYGTDSLNASMRKDRDEVLHFVRAGKRPVVDSTDNLMSLLNENSYQKGSWVLHMLRREQGDSVFDRIIRTYYASYAGKNAGTDDFRKIAEAVSGKNLSTFFQQWLYRGENPSLDISWKYDAVKKQVSVTVRQKQNSVFVFPLTLLMRDSKGNATLRQLAISRQEQEFSFAATTAPEEIIADPQVSLLFEGKVTKEK